MAEITTLAQYIHLVNEALIEVDELQAACEFDEEYMIAPAHFIKPLLATLTKLKQQLTTGVHKFGGEDLAYMKFVATIPIEVLPFKYLLTVINQIHKTARL